MNTRSCFKDENIDRSSEMRAGFPYQSRDDNGQTRLYGSVLTSPLQRLLLT